MEVKPKNPKMIKIKLPKQRIMSLNACKSRLSGQLQVTTPKQINPIIISKENVKQRKSIVRTDDVSNNVCYFEVFDHSASSENSDNAPTERVYVTPQIPIKKIAENHGNKSSVTENVRVYTDNHKKRIKTEPSEIRKKCEEKNEQEIVIQRIMRPCKVKKEIYKKNIASKSQCKTEAVNENQAEVSKKDIQNDYAVQNDEHDTQDTQYVYEIQAEQDIQHELEIPNESLHEEYVIEGETLIKTEPDTVVKAEPQEETLLKQDFEESMDTYFISNKVPDKVTVVKNEDTEVNPEKLNNTFEHANENDVQENTQMTEQNLFQIVTENGTLLLHNNAVVQELIKNGQLIINNEEQEETQEVVLYDGEPIDGTEYVLEYADEAKQETVETVLCNSCGAEFQNLDEFELHQHIHTDEESSLTLLPAPETYLCYCGQNFDDINEFENHQNKHKTNFNIPVTAYSQKFKCNLCSKIFITQSLLDNHMISHTTKDQKKKGPKRKMLPADTPLLCEICSKEFKYKSALSMHMKRHTEGKKYECEICKRRFSQRVGLRKHKFTHINPVTCSHCDLIFRDKDVFEHHKVDGVCPMETSKELIRRWTQDAITENDELGYICTVCNTFYNKEDELEQHIMTSHILDSTTLFCYECGTRASSKEELQAHIITHSQFYHKKVAECDTCGMVFESRARLAVHIRVHTNERPFKCPLCSQTFKTKIHLKSHQLVHTKEKNFPCPVCDKHFALKGNMQAHLRGHTGEKPYVCPLCKEGFKDTKMLKKHKLMIHPVEDMPWEHYLKISKTRPSNLALTRLLPQEDTFSQ